MAGRITCEQRNLEKKFQPNEEIDRLLNEIIHNDPNLILNAEFFDDLWPLILEKNVCEVKFREWKHFVPTRRFDELWAHTLLAARTFKDYQRPIELRCFIQDKLADEKVKKKTKPKCKRQARKDKADTGDKDKDDANAKGNAEDADDEHLLALVQEQQQRICGGAPLLTLTEQIGKLREEHERRQTLAYDYVNRKFPWYIPRPRHDTIFSISERERTEFHDPFEVKLIDSIYAFQCKLVIVDVPSGVPLKELHRWLKFVDHANIVLVLHNRQVAREIKHMKELNVRFTDENLENTWQEELDKSLTIGVEHAKLLNMLKNCALPFVFVFARHRVSTTCDTYRILSQNPY